MNTPKNRTRYPVIDEILESIAPSHEQPASAAGSADHSGTEWCPRCGHKMLIEGDEPPACSYCEQPAPAAPETERDELANALTEEDKQLIIGAIPLRALPEPETGEEWYVSSRSNSENGDATIRKKGAGFSDWVGQVHNRYADQIVKEHNSHHSLIAERERLVEALRDLVRQLPTDERLADYNLDLAEAALTAIDQKGSGSEWAP